MTNLGFQKDKHELRGHVVICSSDYEQELSSYPQCFPKHCGRYISDKIVDENEVEILLNLAKQGTCFKLLEYGVLMETSEFVESKMSILFLPKL